MGYRFEAITRAGLPLGSIEQADNRSVSIALSRQRTASFTLALDNPLVDVLSSQPCRVKVYDGVNAAPLIHGDVIDAEEVAREGGRGTVQFNVADPFWMLAKRLIGRSSTGYTNGTALAPVERGAIAKDIVDMVNAVSETGIRTNASVVPAGATYVGPWTFKPASEAINELAATIDGFDWVLEPIEYTAGKVCDFKTYGALGTFQSNASFEYGHGKHNVKSYRNPWTRQTQLNLGWSLPQGWPDNATSAPLSSQDTDSSNTWGLMEEVIPSDLGVDTLRSQLVQEHVQVRRNPRELWSFDPILNLGSAQVPVFGQDYNVGDLVPLRIKVRGSDGVIRTRVDAVVRVFEVNLTINAEGAVTATTVVAGAD